MKSSAVFAIVAVTVLAGGVLLLEKRSNDAALAQVRHELDGLQKESTVAPTDRSPERLDSALRTMLAGIQAAPLASAEAPRAPELAPPPAPVRRLTVADIHDGFDVAFAEEKTDADWARDARRLAQARLTANLPDGSLLRSVECRGSMCRIETSHVDSAHYRQFAQTSFFGEPSARVWNGAAFSSVVSDPSAQGPVVAVSYLAREGGALPKLD